MCTFLDTNFWSFRFPMGPFKNYDSKEVDGWGQKMAIVDLQYNHQRWVGGHTKVKNMMT